MVPEQSMTRQRPYIALLVEDSGGTSQGEALITPLDQQEANALESTQR